MANNRTVYHVLPNGRNGWKAENVSNHEVAMTASLKEDVVQKILERARREKPSQVVVYKSDGTIQYESNYGSPPAQV